MHEHVQGGRVLIKHQAVALRIADMAIKIEAVRSMLFRAAKAVDDNANEAGVLCDMVKKFAAEEILTVCQHAMELHGGSGSMLGLGIEKYFRDASIFPHMDGTSDISAFRVVKGMFPDTAGAYAGPE